MAFNTNKNIGNSSLGMAIAYFTNHNYTVSIPLNDTQDYDLIVEKNGILSKIQVKGTSFKTKYDVFQFISFQLFFYELRYYTQYIVVLWLGLSVRQAV